MRPATRTVTAIAALGLLAACGQPIGEPVYPVSGDQARNSRSNYKTVVESRGSLIDMVPGGAEAAGVREPDQGGPRVAWRVYADDDGEEVEEAVVRRERTVTPSAAGVSRTLWRAALDTISFMPLESTRPDEGVIVTDWYEPPERANERYRATIYVIGEAPTADNLRVMMQRQRRDGAEAVWEDIPAEREIILDLEEMILTRAESLQSG